MHRRQFVRSSLTAAAVSVALRRAALVLLLAIPAAGCAPGEGLDASSRQPPARAIDAQATDAGRVNIDTVEEEEGISPPNDAVAVEPRYDGRTLAEWRPRIKELDPGDPAAAQSVTGLMEIVADPSAPRHSRRQAALTLGRIGPPAGAAVPLLVKLLDERGGEGEDVTSLWAAKALALFGSIASEAAPPLICRLHDKSLPPAERRAALDALTQIGTAHPDVVAVLIETLGASGESSQLRSLAAESLGTLTGRAAAAVPALLRTARDDDENLRSASVAAIGAVGPQADIAVPTLAELLVFDESPLVRDRAADALSRIGPAAVDLLTRLLSDEEAGVRWRAAQSLGKIGPPAAGAIAALMKTLEDDDANVRLYSLESLWNIRPEAEPLLPFILAEFANEDRQIRIRAYRLLISMGDKAQPAVAPLRELANDPRPHVRQAARKALHSLTGSDG